MLGDTEKEVSFHVIIVNTTINDNKVDNKTSIGKMSNHFLGKRNTNMPVVTLDQTKKQNHRQRQRGLPE